MTRTPTDTILLMPVYHGFLKLFLSARPQLQNFLLHMSGPVHLTAASEVNCVIRS